MMTKYFQTYVTSDGDTISSSRALTEDEVYAFETKHEDEIKSVTEYLSTGAKIIHMNDGGRYEYEEVAIDGR